MDIRYRREQSAGYLTNWAARLFVRAIERRIAGGNAGPMPVFFALIDGGSLTQKDLALWAAVEQPTMANTLARMERDGLIVRTADPADKRSSLVSLTRLGRERAKEALSAAMTVNEFALSGLKPAERGPFLDMLHRVVKTLDAEG
jgi:MarR family transcriptional regulator, transcriptional regulator for hemolysin